ncbi:lipid IV(A) 3-deoxy-D-manno-octulosonic acid transferase [Thalassotalea ponticola]|uniref:lipid IV(A) 3-deoxy-D-manno-octulosonic acid transferase n=1 Tax=Thalassotalea ponticola TaxID=1523392 RepID=UPI0025B5F1A6|nr:lipid IV(A) 3-deoxy-D-manno-octulosonic acid transferase [Thalassotalea ponticola]MDN3652795.1 lipid IV(A) 3-deoxy-D-manno-octulosonic acid transferase [Thalassotalea ponticola]
MTRNSLAFRLYQLVIFILAPLLVVFFLLRSVTHREYRQRLSERFGWVRSGMKSGGIVVHAASVGEVIAIKPFVEGVIARFPELPITVTTFTPTGSAQVVKSFQGRVQHCYLPLDISFCVHLFFKLLRPKAVVLMETELWPTLIQRCAKSDIALLLINARLSDKSMKQYKKLTWLISPALNKFDQILCQSGDHADNFIALGAKTDIVSVSGNLKYDISLTTDVEQMIAELKQSLAPSTRRIIVFGSSHQGEEAQMLKALTALKDKLPGLLLIVVPRHPERFDDVAALIDRNHFKCVRRSDKSQVDVEHDVWLIDTLGELFACYALADICVVAGSFSAIGGHNPLEPALFAKPIVVGPNMANFKEVNQQLIDGRGIVQLAHNEELASTLFHLLNDTHLRSDLGRNAQRVVTANQGATQQSIEVLANLLSQ